MNLFGDKIQSKNVIRVNLEYALENNIEPSQHCIDFIKQEIKNTNEPYFYNEEIYIKFLVKNRDLFGLNSKLVKELYSEKPYSNLKSIFDLLVDLDSVDTFKVIDEIISENFNKLSIEQSSDELLFYLYYWIRINNINGVKELNKLLIKTKKTPIINDFSPPLLTAISKLKHWKFYEEIKGMLNIYLLDDFKDSDDEFEKLQSAIRNSYMSLINNCYTDENYNLMLEDLQKTQEDYKERAQHNTAKLSIISDIIHNIEKIDQMKKNDEKLDTIFKVRDLLDKLNIKLAF